MNKELEVQKQLNESLIEHIERDDNEEVMTEFGKDTLQYCKRVKYLEKAWILVCKGENYYWINQEKVPLDKLRKIKVEEMEDTQGKLKAKLEEICS